MKDLNLLRVFEAVWSTRSVSKAAERLGLTQPTASSALARLRETYADPLFTRVGNQMVPTAFCAQQARHLLEALALVNRSMSEVQSFDPATSNRLFVLGMRDIGEATLLPAVLAHCAREAPAVRIRTLMSPLETTGDKLADARVDLAIGFLPALEVGIHKRELFMQHYVCVMRERHPLASRRLAIRDLKAATHLSIDFSGTGHAMVDRQLREQGLERNAQLAIPHYMTAAPILAGTDLVCLMPEMLADQIAPLYGLVSRPVPLKAMKFPIALYWHERVHRDPGNIWLRGLFTRLHGRAAVRA